jgi:DNA-binding winged helix-turn-helix (wHTH) protein
MIYLFGRCRLDVSSRALTRDSEAVHLSPKAFHLLRLLIEARPKVLTKAELMEQLWPDAFVVEANLPVLVGEVRTATGDGGNGSPVIKTHHGVGYSFAAQTTEMGSFGAQNIVPEGPRLVLHVIGRRIMLVPGINRVGRDHDANVHLNDASVSRAHARIVVEGTAATVEDLASKNGTWVNGVPTHESKPLADGDELMFGSVRARFVIERPDDPTTQTL